MTYHFQMSEILKRKHLFSIIFSLFVFNCAIAQFVDAGVDQTICPGDIIVLGGTPTASGGLAPYRFLWSSSTGVFVDSVANPSVSPADFTIYTVSVTDDTGAVIGSGVVSISLSYIIYVNAGIGINFCLDSSGVIGGANNTSGQGVSYSWSPLEGLDDSTSGQPTASPIITTEYILTATIAGCPPKMDTVIVTVLQPPPINAGNDVTIKEGETITLHATGGFFYEWNPAWQLLYDKTPNPDAEPIITTSYYLYGTDAAKRCFANDTVTVFVEPSNDVVFYNTFTPNDDGNNDSWYIGNIYKYPHNRLEIFNRNGKLMYKANGYLNTWDGKTFLGDELPAATYFYMMDLGEGAGTFHGTVTIIK